MGFLSRFQVPKGVELFEFKDITDALWYGVVNIETAEVTVSAEIPESDSVAPGSDDFRICTGDGDGDYPVFLLDTENWIDDPDPMRPGWGLCIPFYRNFDRVAWDTLVDESEDPPYVNSYTLGYLPDGPVQLIAGRVINYVADIDVDEYLLAFDSNAHRGSGDAFVDIPLHPGRYRVYLIEDHAGEGVLSEDLKTVSPALVSGDNAFDYDVVRILLVVHEDKVENSMRKAYPRNTARIAEISQRLADKNVVGKLVPGPRSYNAVLRSFWLSLWSTRPLHAISWNMQGLTFPPEFRGVFEDSFPEISHLAKRVAGNDLDSLFEWCVTVRGLDPHALDQI